MSIKFSLKEIYNLIRIKTNKKWLFEFDINFEKVYVYYKNLLTLR